MMLTMSQKIRTGLWPILGMLDKCYEIRLLKKCPVACDFARTIFHTPTCCNVLQEKFEEYAKYNPSALSLNQLIEFGSKTGSEQSSYDFLRRELPVRLANIMQEFNAIPLQLKGMPSVVHVRNWYDMSFAEILEFEDKPAETQTLHNFADTLVKIRNRHSNVVETMAQGVLEMKHSYGVTQNLEEQVMYFLDRFYTSRISIRMLINQHALLYGPQLPDAKKHIGSIDPQCHVLDVAKDAYENARFLCEQYYLLAPDVEYELHNPYENTDTIEIVYVPSHMYHILFELLKNAMRAVVEKNPSATDVPPLQLQICKGKEDLTIKISDLGGGIPYSARDLLWKYMYTTAPDPMPSHMRHGSAPLAGYGYGLPLSRVYARYFGGDLVISSLEGYGTDAIVYLKVLSSEANECLPVYNKTASRMYESEATVSDWSSVQPWMNGGSQPSRNFSTMRRTYTRACTRS